MKHQDLIIPKHVAFIADTFKYLRYSDDYITINQSRSGFDHLSSIVRDCKNLDIHIITVYLIPTLFWNTSDIEKNPDSLDEMLQERLLDLIHELNLIGFRLCTIGSDKGIPPAALTAFERARSLTINNIGNILNLALNYGSRDEITRAIKHILEDSVPSESVTESLVNRYLFPTEIQSPELVILTGGMKEEEIHFPIWGQKNAALYSTNQQWVNFGYDELIGSIKYYTKIKISERARRN